MAERMVDRLSLMQLQAARRPAAGARGGVGGGVPPSGAGAGRSGGAVGQRQRGGCVRGAAAGRLIPPDRFNLRFPFCSLYVLSPGMSQDCASAPDFDPVPVRARKDGWTPARQIAFIAALARPAASSRPAGASACRARAPTSSAAGPTRRASAAPGTRPCRAPAPGRRRIRQLPARRQLPRRRCAARASSPPSPSGRCRNGPAAGLLRYPQLPQRRQLPRTRMAPVELVRFINFRAAINFAACARRRASGPAYSPEAFARAARAALKARAR